MPVAATEFMWLPKYYERFALTCRQLVPVFCMECLLPHVQSGKYKVLLIGADKMSSIVDYTDRSTCIIFGDGAGIV
jgi:hypothetical protein